MAQRELFADEVQLPKTTAGAAAGKPRVRTVARQQLELEVVDLESLLPDDHPARTLWAAVEHLDLSQFYAAIEARAGRAGRPATDPKMLVCLWLYATSEGVSSARQLDELCRRHAAYKWICGGLTVNHTLLSEFRVGYEQALDDLLSEVLGKLMAAGLVTLHRVAHDGMRVRASAGAASFRRKPRLKDFVKQARKHVAALKAERATPGERDRHEAARLRAAEDRLRRVEAALAKMPEVEATKQRQLERKARDKAPRVSTTDPEARVMKMADGGFRPAYNLQLSTDVDSRFIVGVSVSTVGSDAQLGPRALDDIERRTGDLPTEFLLDGGYTSLRALDDIAQRGVTVYAPVVSPRESTRDPYARKKADTDATAAWRARMATEEAKTIYKDRSATAETTNADLRCHRGLDRLPVRGTRKVTSVVLWGALAYNLLRAPLEALVA